MGLAEPGEPVVAAVAAVAAVAVAAAEEAVAGCRPGTSTACSLAEGIWGA